MSFYGRQRIGHLTVIKGFYKSYFQMEWLPNLIVVLGTQTFLSNSLLALVSKYFSYIKPLKLVKLNQFFGL